MDSNVFYLKSQSQMLSFSSPLFTSPQKSLKERPVISSKTMNMGESPAMTAISGFKNLMAKLTVAVQRAENRALNVPLISPFTIASSRLEMVENVAIRVELINGCVGWGEAPILPFVTAEDQITAMAKASEACEFLKQSPAQSLGSLLAEIGRILPGHEFASVRAGVEMALIDAVAKSIDLPLWKLFGGVSDSITTDITIPIVSPAEAAELAAKYRKEGFKTLKLKVGKNLDSDIEVLQSIRNVHPDCLFILDANEGYTVDEATEVLKVLHEMGVTPVLFEQPVHRENWEGLGRVTCVGGEKYGVSVAADESCRNLDDVKRIIKDNLANVINIKLAKVGVIGALEIIEAADRSGLDLMIGGMVETRLAMGFAGHLAAGLGCFKFIDLDTPLLLSKDPVLGGYEAFGSVYKFTNSSGHGGFLGWNELECKNNRSKKKMKGSSCLIAFVLAVLVLSEAQSSMAVTCSPIQLSSCVSAITSSSPPSTLCCSKLREQRPCLCNYLRNPNLKKFVNSANARKVARTCGSPFPRC